MLKSLLHVYCIEMEEDWEEGLPWLMLSTREVTQDNNGFSPNNLVFDRDFWHRLYASGQSAKQIFSVAKTKMKNLYDRCTDLCFTKENRFCFCY